MVRYECAKCGKDWDLHLLSHHRWDPNSGSWESLLPDGAQDAVECRECGHTGPFHTFEDWRDDEA